MTEKSKAADALLALVAANSELVGQLQRTTSDIDQLFAERKDALRGSFKPVERGGQPSSAGSNACTPGPNRQAQPPVLIIVEDNADDFMLLKRALWKAGATARVWWAQDGREALAILEEVEPTSPSIGIVSDVRLVGGDGLTLLEQVRARKSSAVVKFALLTGMADPGTEARARDLKADAFFIKPATLSGLIEIARAVQTLVSTNPGDSIEK